MLPMRPEEVEAAKAVAKRAAVAGFVLAVLCHLVPPDYRVVCETLSKLCTGGSL